MTPSTCSNPGFPRFALAAILVASPAFAQPAVESRPEDEPPGALSVDLDDVTQGTGQTVNTVDDAGQSVVGKIVVTAGGVHVVMLPDGSLVERSGLQVRESDRPFKALTREEIEKRLAKRFPGFQIKKTKNYVYVHNTSENFTLGTTKILESMVPGLMKYAKAAGLSPHEPETPLVAIMFRTEKEFQAFRRMPPGVVAYYDHKSNYIVVYEELEALRARPDLALQQSISTIAHEGAHQILHNIGVQKRLSRWPMWVTEGLAEYLAPTQLGKKLSWKGAGVVNDMRMFELEQYVKSKGDEPIDGNMVRDAVAAGRLSSTGYAAAWSLTHFLATKRKKEFNAYLVELSKLGPLEGAVRVGPDGRVQSNVESFEKTFGGEYPEIETKLVAHLRKLPYNDPFADQPHFVAIVSAGQGRKAKLEAATFHNPELARKWIEEVSAKLATATGATPASDIQSFPNRAAAQAHYNAIAGGK